MLYKFDEVIGHGMAIVCDKDTIFCCAKPQDFGVGNAGTLAMAVSFLAVFGIGWGFFDCNNMPILSQILRPEMRATGYGIMNFVSMMCGGVADWGFGAMTDRGVPLNMIFGVFALVCVVSLGIVLMIRPKPGA